MSAHLTIYRDLISKVNAVELDTPAGVTLDTCLSKLTDKYTPSSSQPFVALVNGREIPSSEWGDTLLETGDEVTLKPRPFAQFLPYVYYALVAAAAVYSYQQMQDLKNLNENYKDLPEQSGTYDVNAQGNAARLKQPIPVGFGRMRIWPDFGALPFRRYKGNKQYLYYLFCLGEVQCSLHDKKIGSTPLSSFEEVQEQLYQPGEPITLFHSEVFTSPEASNVELFAPNDADYTGPSVAYTVAPDGRNVVGIELDFVCPSLYKQNKKNGNLESISLTVGAEYCAIDAENEPDNNWQPLGEVTLTGATVDAIRETFTAEVPAGRYAVRAYRSSPSQDPDSVRISDDVYLAEVKGLIESDAVYDQAMWAVKILVDDQLASAGETIFNGIYQAWLPVWTGTEWTAPQATRNPAWAFCAAVKAEYGGGYTDEMLDLPTIKHYADVWEAREDYFDYFFDTKGTLKSVLTMICAAGRAETYEYKGVHTIVRDEYKPIPDLIIGNTEIIAGSYSEDLTLYDQWENDSVLIQYVDGDSGLPFELLCVLPGYAGDNPLTIKKEGITNAEQAYREGMFEAAKRVYRTFSATYKTDTLGALVDYGSVVSVNTFHSRYEGAGSLSGEIIGLESNDNGSVSLWLSEPTEFEQGHTYVIMVGDSTAKPQGPYVITPTADPYKITINQPGTLKVKTNPNRKRSSFQIGQAEAYGLKMITRKCKDLGDFKWQITGIIDAPEVHQFDDLIADGTLPVPEPDTLFTRELAQVTGLRFKYTGSAKAPVLHLSWNPVGYAENFIIQIRYADDQPWQNFVTTKNLWASKQVSALTGRVRIAAQNVAVGPWFELDVSIDATGDIMRPETPTGLELAEAFTGTSLKAQWDEQADATTFRLAICNAADGVSKRVTDVVGNRFEYTAAMAKTDGVGRSILLKLWAVGEDGRTSYNETTLTANNPQIGALTNIQSYDFIESGMIACDYPAETDFGGFLVWMSDTSGFTPDDTTLVKRSASQPIDIPKTGVMYARIAGFDVWGEDDLDISSEIQFVASEILETQLNEDLKSKINNIPDLGDVEERLTTVEEDVAAVDQRIDTTRAEIEEGFSTSLDAYDTRISQTEEDITLLGQSYEGVQTSLAGKADSTALTTQISRIDDIDGEIESLSEAVTGVQSSVGVNLLSPEWADVGQAESLPSFQVSGSLTRYSYSSTASGINGRINVARLAANSTNSFLQLGGDDSEELIPVVPGETYIFSVYVHQWSSGSAKAVDNLQTWIRRFSQDKSYVTYTGLNHSVPINAVSRVSHVWVCPSDTFYVRLRVDNESFNDSGTTYQAYACFMFEHAKSGQAEPSVWSPGMVAAASQLALKTAVTETEGRVDSISSATLKVQTRSSDGALVAAGIGAEATGEGSTVLIRADRIGLIGSGTADQLALSVEGGKTVIPNAGIGSLAVDDAKMKNVRITKLIGTDAQFQSFFADNLVVKEALIENESVTKSKIKEANVETLHIKGDAVTVSSFARSSTGIYLDDTWKELTRIVVDAEGGNLILQAACLVDLSKMDLSTYQGAFIRLKDLNSGSTYSYEPIRVKEATFSRDYVGITWYVGAFSGYRTFILEGQKTETTAGNVVARFPEILSLSVKR